MNNGRNSVKRYDVNLGFSDRISYRKVTDFNNPWRHGAYRVCAYGNLTTLYTHVPPR